MSCYVTQAPTAIKLVVAMEPPDARGGRVLLTVILTFFVSSTGFSMMLPSLSFFLRELAPSFTESRMHLWLGLCVSANAIGQGLASPLAGMWMRHSGHFAPLIASLIISQIGSVMFLLARPLSHNLANLFAASPEICGVVLVMVARLLIGISDSNLTVCRVLLLQLSPLPASNDEENDASGERMERCKATRTKYLSYESAARSLGLIMGAVLSSGLICFVCL
jgi:MFS family permease